jgi:RND family efflux transporter MFP subunit
LVSAGDHVKRGQLLFELDKRDLTQAKRAADAQVAAARQAVATAKDELERAERLFKSRYVSEQARDQAQLRLTEAKTRVDATESTARQADNALGYTQLVAPADGIVTETFVETGQVVMPGQRVGEFAYDGQREIEVYLPQGFVAPSLATVQIDDKTFEASRQEVSGAADRGSRTFRARYALPEAANQLAIGAIAQLSVTSKASAQVVSVNIGALDERGQGPRVWIVTDGRASPIPVEVVSLSIETALIKTDLPVGTPVIAMGTHLLKPDMAVRVQPQ